MMLETIFLWAGGMFLISLVVTGITFCWMYIYNRWIFGHYIAATAVFWWLGSEWLERNNNEDYKQLRENKEWWVQFRGKRYLWRIVKIEDVQK